MWGALVEARGRRGLARAGARPARLRRLAARSAAHVAADGRRRRRASTTSAPMAPSRCASTTGAGSSACAGRATTPSKVRALVICATGFFPDGKWHGLAKAMRTEGEGEEIVDGTTREALRPDARRGRSGHRRAGDRRVLQGLRRPRAPPRPARALPLGRLRRARALSGPAGRPRRADAAALRLRGPLRARRHARIASPRRSRTRVPRSSTASGTSCSTRCPSARRRSSWTSSPRSDRATCSGPATTGRRCANSHSEERINAGCTAPWPCRGHLHAVRRAGAGGLGPSGSGGPGTDARLAAVRRGASDVTCATARVPLDYDQPAGPEHQAVRGQVAGD